VVAVVVVVVAVDDGAAELCTELKGCSWYRLVPGQSQQNHALETGTTVVETYMNPDNAADAVVVAERNCVSHLELTCKQQQLALRKLLLWAVVAA
jgi:hypothetical protein